MNKLKATISDLDAVSNDTSIDYVLTRFWTNLEKDPDDLDIYVNKDNFRKFARGLKSLGYKSSSHDKALGGRMAGAQLNLVKNDRIKVDLHNDFTWRKDRYLDLELVEHTKDRKKIDAFLTMINIIFEKSYITEEEYEIFYKNKTQVFGNDEFTGQAKNYNWYFSYNLFKKWINSVEIEKRDLPVFIPFYIIIASYVEALISKGKFHLISFMYYFFFKTRYLFTKKLPYD